MGNFREKLVKTLNPKMYKIHLKKEIDFKLHPTLDEVGTWIQRLGSEWRVVLPSDSPMEDFETFKSFMLRELDCSEEEIEIIVDYQVPGAPGIF